MRILFAGGGTAGHINPALAILKSVILMQKSVILELPTSLKPSLFLKRVMIFIPSMLQDLAEAYLHQVL